MGNPSRRARRLQARCLRETSARGAVEGFDIIAELLPATPELNAMEGSPSKPETWAHATATVDNESSKEHEWAANRPWALRERAALAGLAHPAQETPLSSERRSVPLRSIPSRLPISAMIQAKSEVAWASGRRGAKVVVGSRGRAKV